MIRLFTTAFETGDTRRKSECFTCLKRNLDNPFVGEVCVMVEGTVADLPQSPKLRTRSIEKRPLYDEFFSWMNALARPGDVSLLANADIWTDRSIAVLEESLSPAECYAIARWEGDAVFDRNDSQDAWAFRGAVRKVHGDFPIGVPRCDNRILYELQEAGYVVRNPAYAIRVHHEHAGVRHEYGSAGPDFVDPPYRYLWPHNLWSPFQTLVHNVRHPDRRVSWQVNRRRVMGALPFRVASGMAHRAGHIVKPRSDDS